MRSKFIQEIIDYIRLKKLKEYLNENPILLKLLLNILGLSLNKGSEARVKLLRFCGAKIGKNVKIGDDVYIFQPKNLELGDYVGIADNTVMRCWNKVSIDNYTFLAINSVFIPGSHNTYNYENLDNQEIKIGKGCWIGANCTIMGGAKINNGSIIGTGSVVLGKEYPPFSIIVGVPAKAIKKREMPDMMTIPTKYKKEELLM